MLTLGPVLTHKNIDVYPDDEDPNLFYLLPSRPVLRAENGKPVFRATFWTDDGRGPVTNSVAGLRGALLHFDVNLAVAQETQDAIVQRIRDTGVQQQRVDAMEQQERERLQRMARALGADADVRPRARVPTIREPRFGAIQFLEGKVELLEEKSGGFVEWSSAGGAPSLMGDNNAAFALRLGPEGAAVWYRALEQDASAIGVRYELKFQMRLPSLEIHVWAGAHQDLELTRKAERVIENMDQGCSDADVEHIDVKEVSEKLTEEGLINVEIIKGSAKISDEQVSQLRNTAIDLISDRVKEIMTHKIRGMTEAERQSSLVGKVTEEVTSFAELRLTQRDVITWGANPQATITEFLGGITGDARKQMITLVDLSNPVVSTVEVEVSADANWDADPGIARVIVRVEYPPAKNDPRSVQEFSFTKAEPASQTFRIRRAANDLGTVNYSALAYVKGARDPIDLGKGRSNGRVYVQVPELGSFKFKLRPHPTIFNGAGAGKISAVQVDYEYKQAGAPDHCADIALLRPADLETGVSILKVTNRMIDAPIRFRPTYLREGAPEIVGAWQQVWVQAGRESIVEVPSAWRDALQVGVRVLPAEGLKRVQFEVKYDDAADASAGKVVLEADGPDGGSWTGKLTLNQLDKTKQRFSYRYSVEANEQLTVGPWVEAEGDQEITLPLLPVRLRTDRLKLGTSYTDALVRMRYADPGRDYEATHEFYLQAETPPVTWLVPRVSSGIDGYFYSMTLFDAAGASFEVLERPAHGANLLLTPPA